MRAVAVAVAVALELELELEREKEDERRFLINKLARRSYLPVNVVTIPPALMIVLVRK
jgi:hypothetical protein